MWFLLILALDGPRLMENKDVLHAFQSLEVKMAFLVERFNRKEPMPSLSWLASEVDRLETALAHDTKHRLHIIDGPSILLEAKNQALFDKPPVLPPENKAEDRWTFSTIRFEVLPLHLFIYGLKFQGKNTLRLREVRFYFRDGSVRDHDRLFSADSDSGVEIPDNTFTPLLAAWPENGTRIARRLAAIEIVGSAQDGAASSDLDFVMEVPDPDAKPFPTAHGLVGDLKKRLSAKTVDAGLLNLCLADLAKLANSLEITAQPGPSVRN